MISKVHLMFGYVLVGTSLFVAGCETVGPHPALNAHSVEQATAELELGVSDNEKLIREMEIREQELSDSVALMEETEEPEDRFDLSVNGALAKDFFHSLVADTDYNVVVHPEVKGKISLDLSNVTVGEVMDIMQMVYGYDYRRKRNLFQIYPDALRTEIFQVNYLNVLRSGRSEMQVSAGKVSDSARGGGNNEDQNDSDPGNKNRSGSSSVVGTQVDTQGESDFWKELNETLQTIVAADVGSSVVLTPQVGLAVVRAMPESLATIRGFLEQVEDTLHRQVILEAKIVEVTLKEGFQAGINWHSFGDASGGTFEPTVTLDSAGNTIVTAGSEHSTAAEFTFGGGGQQFNPLGSGFALSSVYGDFSAAIKLLKTQGAVQVLSSPRIATVNNQKAVIKVGEDEFFVTDISSNTITAGSAINTLESPELTPFFSGIALDVTPQISGEGDVILHIHPTVSQVKEQLKIISGDEIPLAASTIRESDSIVRARSGQIIVIGGLMQNSSNDDNARVPGAGSVPGLGHLFKNKVQSSTKSELVILLKPIVVKEQDQIDYMRRSIDQIEKLRRKLRGTG